MKKYFYNLILLFSFFTVGYANSGMDINIVGCSSINNPKWNIYFDNIEALDISKVYLNSNKDTISSDFIFSVPGEFFEYSFDVINSGSIDGVISSITSKVNKELITTLPNYLKYEISYIDGSPILPNQVLKSGEKKRIKVKIMYSRDVTALSIPKSIEVYNISHSIKYVQRDNV